ncbi:hypothetical protein QAD02_008179 [Eretmocerus hayati]|uniref:Uncharacterized protein n=1 Tax=Eretmocerus hayati TaxID=131215 RepID=A0ACC2N616_9HYME|nr:hypothetical protein QAD02_008179 [Eretmocerus hayati]
MDILQMYASSDEEKSDDSKATEHTFQSELNPDKMTRRERNKRRNLGQSYLSSANKLVPAREWVPLEDCEKECCSRVTREDQKCIFISHWRQGTYQKRSLRDQHQKDANEAYNSKRADKERASRKIDKTEIVCCFDLQQCMPTPKLNTSDCFYLRQLWTYNLTIRNMTMNTTSCYMWHESTGNGGANDVASCLHGFVKALPNSVEHVTVYSDNCSGQNKNKMSAGMFTTDVRDKPSLKMIDHKFLIVGHTHMEFDSDHATIERSIKIVRWSD